MPLNTSSGRSNNQNKNLKRLTVISVVFMPINVIAGIGGMSEYTMMTHDMPWPIAYSALILVMIIIGMMTFWGLRVLESHRARSDRAENHKLTLCSGLPTIESRE